MSDDRISNIIERGRNYVRSLILDGTILRDGEPCKHYGCIAHISAPCEVCHRRNTINPLGAVFDAVDDLRAQLAAAQATIKRLEGALSMITGLYAAETGDDTWVPGKVLAMYDMRGQGAGEEDQ